MLEEILETYSDEELMKADGYDEAIIGVDEKSFRLIYSVKKCLEILEKEMSYASAYDISLLTM